MAPMSLDLGAILTAMVTPFDARGELDEDVAVRLMDHLLDHGSDGLVLCGTTGEAATLSDEEKLRLIRLGVQEARRSHPEATIVAGVGHNDTRLTVELTQRATELRPDALLVVNPYYNKPSRKGIIRHFEEVSKATDLPMVLYNIPQRTAQDMPNDLLSELAQIDNVVAVKQANPRNLARVEGLAIYAGNDDLLADVLDLGEPGGVLVASHVVGEQMRGMVDEPDRRREIDQSLHDVYRELAVAPLACSVKTALSFMGIDAGIPRLPYVELDESERETIRRLLDRHGLLATAA